MIEPRRLRALYEAGENISAWMRNHLGTDGNSDEIIELAYDMQAGSYVRALSNPEAAAANNHYAATVAKAIQSLCSPEHVLEAGVGEATTLAAVLSGLSPHVEGYGFDLSWSRVAVGRRWLQQVAASRSTTLCTGSLLRIPFADNSIDVVYTSHSIEPNGGREAPILGELYRVARQYLLLLEPAYEFADPAARQRMDSHGYCRDLAGVARALGMDVIAHELFPFGTDPANPTALTVIRKDTDAAPGDVTLACPRYRSQLIPLEGVLFCPEGFLMYPVIGGIPCLRVENAVVASLGPDVLSSG